MNDSRFHTLGELAELVDGLVVGDPSVRITGLNGFEFAGSDEITFLLDRRQLPTLAACPAAACIVARGTGPQPIPTIECPDPAVAAARIHSHLLARPFQARGVHPTAVIGDGCRIPLQVSVGPLVCLGDGVVLGERVTIHPGVVVGDGVLIGDDTIIHANATIAEGCAIGRRVIIHHGAVIGSDGFGFATDRQGRHFKRPQVGTVRIDDEVEIGANACVDRANFGTTWIRSGVRIDNLVQVAHNVVIGENSVLVAQVGIAGSTTLGRSVVLGGMTGVAGHLHLEDQVMAAAMSGIHSDQPKGARIGGIPAKEAKHWMRCNAAYHHLPDMARELRRLRKEVDRLGNQLNAQQHTASEEE